MKFFHYGKDGGEYSKVWGFFLVEIKSLFSIVLLKFENGSREAFHEHAFNSISWVLKGELFEIPKDSGPCLTHKPSLKPILTYRRTFHKVHSIGRTWVLSFRGPWWNTWKEYISGEERYVTLTHGRKEL